MSELKVNTISEVTGANGVVIDSVKLKDGEVYATKIQYTDGDDAIKSNFKSIFAEMLGDEDL